MNSLTGLITFLIISGGTLVIFVAGVLIACAIEEYRNRKDD